MIGDKIKAQRLAMGLTQEELAARMGYKSKSTINKIELNINDIPLSKVEEFAKVLHVSTAYLMDWLPQNIITPAARPVPVLGTICAGDGIVANEHFVGQFFIDSSVHADYALKVKGDSMIDAEIYDGDMAFIKKEFDLPDNLEPVNILAIGYTNEKVGTLRHDSQRIPRSELVSYV